MGIFKATVIKPLFQLINHINMGQDTRDMANTALFSSIYVTDRGPSAPAHGLRDSGELRLPPKGAVLSPTLLLVWCLR